MKNVPAPYWDYIILRIEERKSENKLSVVKVNGFSVPPDRIRREKKRREQRVTTYERLVRSKSKSL
jgi:hypothetical protein